MQDQAYHHHVAPAFLLVILPKLIHNAIILVKQLYSLWLKLYRDLAHSTNVFTLGVPCILHYNGC